MPAGSGRYPSGQRGQTVNLLAYAFGGSTPPLPTTCSMRARALRAQPRTSMGGNSSAVERQPSKLGVAGSNPVSRSIVARAAGRPGAGVPALEASNVRVSRAAGRPGAGVPAPEASNVRVSRAAGRPGAGVPALEASVGASLASRMLITMAHNRAHVAQLVEHALGKGEVSGSIPDMGSRSRASDTRVAPRATVGFGDVPAPTRRS